MVRSRVPHHPEPDLFFAEQLINEKYPYNKMLRCEGCQKKDIRGIFALGQGPRVQATSLPRRRFCCKLCNASKSVKGFIEYVTQRLGQDKISELRVAWNMPKPDSYDSDNESSSKESKRPTNEYILLSSIAN